MLILKLLWHLQVFGLPGSAPGFFRPFPSFLSFSIQLAVALRYQSKMKFSTQASLLSLGFVAPLVSAAPFRRAADNNTMLVLRASISHLHATFHIEVRPRFIFLEFANVLEQLETQFYSQALTTFQASDFTAAGFTDAQVPIEQFTAIATDESTHATVLTQTIIDQGSTPLAGCSFDFTSVLTDVATMAVAARLVENVGVGAYLGS